MMQSPNNVSDADLVNWTCLNETCNTDPTSPNPPTGSLKWGLLALLMVIFCTALGNLLVCLAVCWDRRLQNMTNYFLMSLAIADFLVSIIVMPFGMVVEIYGYFPMETGFCTFWVTMDVLMCTASIWHMCTMSMDRYFTLKYPMQYGRNKTKTMVLVKIVFVWLLSITITSPICIYGLIDETKVYIRENKMCLITLKEYAMYGSIFAFYIPLCIMILTYLLTLHILRQNQKIMRTIDRSDFRLRPRHNTSLNKSCKITTLVSPPSSESRRESHTDVSSICRTPMREKLNMLGNELKELKQNSSNSESSFFLDQTQKNNNNTTKETPVEEIKHDTDTDQNEPVQDIGSFMKIPDTRIQSPSSEDDDDESSMLLPSAQSKISRSNSNSPCTPRFRLRTNTDVSINYPSSHSSLKIPKSSEKQNLQASVSCSNFYQSNATEGSVHSNNGLHSCGLANRDYKSLEWCQHFYEIQEEMDECLREARLERRYKSQANKTSKLTPLSSKDESMNSTENQSMTLKENASVKKDELKPFPPNSADVSESGDSMDDLDSSSENVSNSDLLTIKLYPKSVYMYKLDVPRNSLYSPPSDPAEDRPNGIIKRGSYSRADSLESDKSLEGLHRVHQKRSSIKNFLRKCKKSHGLKHMISSKATSNEKKASKVLGIIFAVFVVLWTPFFAANLLGAICSSCQPYITPEMMSAFVWMGYIASLANPIIYTMFNTAFRRAFIRILSCDICRHSRRQYNLSSAKSNCYAASVYTDRRQTLTVLLNNQDRLSDFSNNYSKYS